MPDEPNVTQEFHVVLYEPLIPQNTGSIARLCACTGATLDLIHPLGFRVDEASVKRAGLDYWPHVKIHEWKNWNHFFEAAAPKKEELFFFTKFANVSYAEARFPDRSFLVFGNETRGLPPFIHETFESRLYKVPMRTELVRSLNLAQCAAVALYEAQRQHNFPLS